MLNINIIENNKLVVNGKGYGLGFTANYKAVA